MEQYRVKVKLLNKRTKPEENTASKSTVSGQVKENDYLDLSWAAKLANGDWYTDGKGRYYWGGGLEFVKKYEDILKTNNQLTTYKWFVNLQIERIWNVYETYGENVLVAVLDTGYDISNLDLIPAVKSINVFTTNTPPLIDKIDTPLINDSVGHGTFCSSIIAAQNTIYQVGIAPKCKLLIGKITEYGGLNPYGLDRILSGISWAVNAGAEIISISLGKFSNEIPGDGYIDIVQSKLNKILENKNVLIFASSGDNYDNELRKSECYPASLKGCVSIGASNNNSLSNITVLSNNTVIHASGIDIESYYDKKIPEKKSGTSMSTAIIAGIATLAISYQKKIKGSWKSDILLNKIIETADPIPSLTNKKIINPINLFKELN